jgi:hypothetical protein
VETDPDGGTGFGFSGSLGSFTLNDDQSTGACFDPGTYAVTLSSVPDNWHLTDISCTDPSGGTTSSLTTSSATVGIEADDDVVCVFTSALVAVAGAVETATPTVVVLPAAGTPSEGGDLSWGTFAGVVAALAGATLLYGGIRLKSVRSRSQGRR